MTCQRKMLEKRGKKSYNEKDNVRGRGRIETDSDKS